MTTQQHSVTAMAVERDETIENAVVELLNLAVVPVAGTNREKWECKMCGERDDNHTDTCPVPALEQWINPI